MGYVSFSVSKSTEINAFFGMSDLALQLGQGKSQSKLNKKRDKQDEFVDKMRKELHERFGSTDGKNSDETLEDTLLAFQHAADSAKADLAFAQAKQKITTQMACAWTVAIKLVFVGLGIDDKSMCQMRQGRALISALFYVLLVFTDLDALGFFLSYSTYWRYAGLGHEVVKAILVFFPIAYLGVLVMNCQKIDQDDSESKPGSGEAAMAMMSRPPSPMKMVHFVPLLRGQLYLHHPTRSDIEAVFRINTLSSFSLGVAQFAGLTFYLFVGEDESGFLSRLTPTIIVNMVSLFCNWSVTILYYCTTIPDKMKDAVGAQALDARLDEVIQKDKEDLSIKVKEVSKVVGEAKAKMCGADDDGDDHPSIRQATDEVKSFRRQMMFEMLMLEDVLIDLKGIPVDDLEKIRSRVFKKYSARFRALGA